jgi:hypothetical protein
VYYDTGTVPVLFAMSNLPSETNDSRELDYKGIHSGYVVHCAGGYYAGGRGGGQAFDPSGKSIQKFHGDSGAKHARNFVDAVRSRDPSRLNAEVQIGHQSTAWCNLANIALEAAASNEALKYQHDKAVTIARGLKAWDDLIATMEQHLAKNSVDVSSGFRLSPIFDFDKVHEQFVGEKAAGINRFLRREYRPRFEVPAVA